jgi:transcriptional regulator with XRE-family HTH domain
MRRYRRDRGWTQAQLARQSGVSPATISRLERGDDLPLARTVAAVAKALGVEPDRLLGLEGQPPLFPLPDQRRVDLLRRVLALDDERVEAAYPALVRALDAAAVRPRPRPALRRKSRS